MLALNGRRRILHLTLCLMLKKLKIQKYEENNNRISNPASYTIF
jgi:hypothetical protein